MNPDKPDIIRPWGGYTILKKSPEMWVKKLYLNKGMRFSLQSHEQRSEFWFILSGTVLAQVGNKQLELSKGDHFFIPKKRKHRLQGITHACILEFAYGKTLEHDILRYEDDFNRIH